MEQFAQHFLTNFFAAFECVDFHLEVQRIILECFFGETSLLKVHKKHEKAGFFE